MICLDSPLYWVSILKGINRESQQQTAEGKSLPSPSLPAFRADTFLHSSAAEGLTLYLRNAHKC